MTDTVHFELSFNKMIMTVSDRKDQCRQDTRFWLPWENWTKLEMFLKLNQLEKVDNKKTFGILVAGRIVQLCR